MPILSLYFLRRCLLSVSLLLTLFGFSQSAMAAHPQVLFKTNFGDFVLELYEDKAPISVKNVLDYLAAGHYNGTFFHRSVANFIVQGGGYTPDLVKKPTNPNIVLESNNGLSNAKGTVALARKGDPNSANSQFFVNMKDNPNLDYGSPSVPGYTVFGRVIRGFAVFEKINQLPRKTVEDFTNVPEENVIISESKLLSAAEYVVPEAIPTVAP
jgi:peptidyl-prolyl cis-trans isomerase A (cyclophilin A)